MYTNEYALELDSTYAAELLETYDWAKRQPEFASRIAFAKSTVQLVEVHDNFSDYSLHDFHYCEAHKTDTSVQIYLKYEFAHTHMEGRFLEISVVENDFKTSIIHFSDVMSRGGKFPESEVYFDQVWLNKQHFERADTL